MKTPPSWSQFADAMREGRVDTLQQMLAHDPTLKSYRPPSAGGSWLHVAARYAHVPVVELLIDTGFDVNDRGTLDGDVALVRAAAYRNAMIARYLLDAGSVMDTDASVRNPLFAAIVGQSPDVVRLLLERGIDAGVRYNSETMTDMDATAFALWRGENDLARLIALHLAGGNEAKAQALLNEARDVVSRNAPLETVRIVPSMEDLEPE